MAPSAISTEIGTFSDPIVMKSASKIVEEPQIIPSPVPDLLRWVPKDKP